MGRWTAARCTASVSKRGGSRRACERAGSHEAMRAAGRQRGRSSKLAEARSGSSQASFRGLCRARSVKERHRQRGAIDIRGGPVCHPPTLQRNASGTIAMTQREGPEAGPPVSPPLFGPEGLAEAKQRAGLGPRDGPPGGTVTDPEPIDEQSVIGLAGDGARSGKRLGQDKTSPHVRRKPASSLDKS
jgi:hypothetical protein